jgi:hypothetical protein
MTEIENIELNIDPDPSIFKFPISPEMQKLKFMEGNWSVILESRGRSGLLQRADSTASAIQFVDGKNLLQESITYTNYFPVQKINSWSYNAELENYLLTTYNSFYSATSVYTGNFDADTLVLDNTLVKFNDETAGRLTKYSIMNTDNNKMIVEVSQSSDAGETWAPVQRFTYTRIEE